MSDFLDPNTEREPTILDFAQIELLAAIWGMSGSLSRE